MLLDYVAKLRRSCVYALNSFKYQSISRLNQWSTLSKQNTAYQNKKKRDSSCESAWNEYEESDNIYVSNLRTQHSYVIFNSDNLTLSV